MSAIDPITLARFMVLDGAVELLEAFASIPPGPLRSSVIQHAQVIAASYTAAPPEHRAPDPLSIWATLPHQQSASPIALPEPAPRRKGPANLLSETPTSRAVERVMRGDGYADAASAEGLRLDQVQKAVKEARKGGAQLPQEPKAVQRSFPIHAHELNSRSIAGMSGAANKRGITLEKYLERRRTVVEMRQAHESFAAIAKKTKEELKVVKKWLFDADKAGHAIPKASEIIPPAKFTDIKAK